jgi:hypothetical protein
MLFQVFGYIFLVIAGTAPLSGQTTATPAVPAATGSARGIVLDEEGKSVAGATVFAAGTPYKPSTLSNEAGKFLLEGLSPGNWGLLAYKKADGYPPNFFAFFSAGPAQVPAVEVAAGKIAENVIVRLGPKAAYLNFDIADQSGKSVSAAATFTRPDMEGNGDFGSSVGANERFLVPPIPFRLTVESQGCEPWHYGGGDWRSDRGLIKLRPGETQNLPVRLRCIKQK